MAYEDVKEIFPDEGHLCIKGCGECCAAGTPLAEAEADAIAEWLLGNVEYETLRDQFWHSDTQPDKCCFLTPEKTCFIYPVRPVACVQFGHLPDVKCAPEDIRKAVSQKCPRGINFTEVSWETFVARAMEWYITSLSHHGQISSLRQCLVVKCESGEEGPIPQKP